MSVSKTSTSAIAAAAFAAGLAGGQFEATDPEQVAAAGIYTFIAADPVRAAQAKIMYDDLVPDVADGDATTVGELGGYLSARLAWTEGDPAEIALSQEAITRIAEAVSDGVAKGDLGVDDPVSPQELLVNLRAVIESRVGAGAFDPNIPSAEKIEALKRAQTSI